MIESLNRTGLVVLRRADLVDVNGDQDGFADTNESVDLLLTFSNKTGGPITNLVVRLVADGPHVDCIANPSITLDRVDADSDFVLPEAFHMRVSAAANRDGPDVSCLDPGPSGTCSNFVRVAGGCTGDSDCRRTATQDYSVGLILIMNSDQFTFARHHTIRLDLDLDTVSPAAPTTTFVEGFETGLGSFTFQNLDVNRASNSASNGYRCQYTDPDNPYSLTFGEPECYLGFASAQGPPNDWHSHTTTSPDGGRAALGTRSLHYGKHVAGGDTYALSQLDAIRTKAPVTLAARICRDDPSANPRACAVDTDCANVGGGPCVAASPELSLKQQVALVAAPLVHGVADKGVVEVQVNGSGVWEKVPAYRNVYNALPYLFSNCAFDPIDDGSDEDTITDYLGPHTPIGPSSTCYPEFVFNHLGKTSGAYLPANVGDASDGPGLAGSLGPGTWIESRFDLSRYRGRAIFLRLLVSTLKVGDSPDYESIFMWNPTPDDDGWYVDDVRISQTLGAVATTVTSDSHDNTALPGDADGDGRADLCDCAPLDASAISMPAAVAGFMLLADRIGLSWDSSAPVAGSGVQYDLMRGFLNELPVGAGAGEVCIAGLQSATTATDPEMPAVDTGFYYLVRARNSCGVGTYGSTRCCPERASPACP